MRRIVLPLPAKLGGKREAELFVSMCPKHTVEGNVPFKIMCHHNVYSVRTGALNTSCPNSSSACTIELIHIGNNELLPRNEQTLRTDGLHGADNP